MGKLNNFLNAWAFDIGNRIRFIVTFLCVILGLTQSFTCGVCVGLVITVAVVLYELYMKFVKKHEFIGAKIAYTALGWMIALLCYVPFDAFM